MNQSFDRFAAAGFSMPCADSVIQTDILLRCDTVCQVRIPKKETVVCSVYPDRTGFPVPGPLCSRRFSHPLRLQDPWSCPNRTERPEDLNLHRAGFIGALDNCNFTNLSGVIVQNPVMVISACHFKLVKVCIDPFADQMRLCEVHRCTFYA